MLVKQVAFGDTVVTVWTFELTADHVEFEMRQDMISPCITIGTAITAVEFLGFCVIICVLIHVLVQTLVQSWVIKSVISPCCSDVGGHLGQAHEV